MNQTSPSTVATPLWSRNPSSPKSYYVNSVAASFDGSRVIAGTFYKVYAGSDVDSEPRRIDQAPTVPPADSDTPDPQLGPFGAYGYDLAGNLSWKDEYSGWQGLFWVDAASNAPVCAVGGWYSKSPSYKGVVRAYDTGTGAVLLQDTPGASRINQVSLSADGSLLLAAGDALYLYQNTGAGFSALGSPALASLKDSVVSAFIAGNGSLAVCTTLKHGVFVFSIDASGLSQIGTWAWPVATGACHSVVVNAAGTGFALGGSGGYYALFKLSDFVVTGQPSLVCTAPGNAVVYSVAMTDACDALFAVANVSQGATKGLVLCNKPGSSSPAWTYATVNCPNRVVLNPKTSQLAVADGYPDGCPGNFYLLDANTGAEAWHYTTGNMCWGIAISSSGTLVAGGSDDSNAYAFNAGEDA